jgi:hypothetical protein
MVPAEISRVDSRSIYSESKAHVGRYVRNGLGHFAPEEGLDFVGGW